MEGHGAEDAARDLHHGRTHHESRPQESEAKKWLCVISMMDRERQKVRVGPTVGSHCLAEVRHV